MIHPEVNMQFAVPQDAVICYKFTGVVILHHNGNTCVLTWMLSLLQFKRSFFVFSPPFLQRGAAQFETRSSGSKAIRV
jgi:hypothetical protein